MGNDVLYMLKYSYLLLRRYALSRGILAIVMWCSGLIVFYYSVMVKRSFVDELVKSVTQNRVVVNVIIMLSVLLFVLWILGFIFDMLGEYYLQVTSIHALRGLALEFIKRISFARPLALRRSGDVLARFISDLPGVSELSGVVPSLVIQVARLCVSIFTLYVLSPILLGVALLMLPFYYLVFRASSGRLAKASEAERKAFSNATDTVKNIVDNALFVRISVSHGFAINYAKTNMSEWLLRLLRLLRYRILFQKMFYNLYDLLSLVLLLVGGYLVATGFTTVGTVIAFVSAVYNLYEPLGNMSYMMAHLAERKPYVNRVKEILSIEEEKLGNIKLGDRVKSIEFREAHISIDGKEVLRGLNLNLCAGKVYAIVGPSGSGKTTLLLSVIGVYRANKGSILINGRRIEEFDVDSLRSSIRYVSANEPIFTLSLRDNIVLSKHNISDKELWQILDIAQVDFIRDLNTYLDPRKLSDGQRQRIVLARALASKPRVLLLDESLDAVDAVTEATILSKLVKLVKENKLDILIIVSHRASALKHVDEVLVIDSGKIIAKGKHEELLEKCRLYKEIIARQSMQTISLNQTPQPTLI